MGYCYLLLDLSLFACFLRFLRLLSLVMDGWNGWMEKKILKWKHNNISCITMAIQQGGDKNRG
jgi:hypothetical protein